jgi:DNA-binding transcriptional MerR regulator
VPEDPRYAIGDLADMGGVSRRTVRYYVQEGLLPAPFGVGRGNHYGPEHLAQLLRVKALQEAGHTLDEIRHALNGEETAALEARRRAPSIEQVPLVREVWRRLALAPGVELHVAGDVRLPPPGALAELAEWCRMNFVAAGRPASDPS